MGLVMGKNPHLSSKLYGGLLENQACRDGVTIQTSMCRQFPISACDYRRVVIFDLRARGKHPRFAEIQV